MFGMKWRVRELGGLLVLGVLAGSAWGQLPEQSGRNTERLPEFLRGVYTFLNADGETEARLVHQIFYDALQFEAEDGGFAAGYELAVQVDGENDEVVKTQVISRRVTVLDFEETHSIVAFDAAEQRFKLAPGKYLFTMALTDVSTKKTAQDRFEVTIPELGKNALEVSSLVYGYRARSVAGESVWRPFASDVVPEKIDSLRMRFEVYYQDKPKTVPVKWTLKGSDKFKREGTFDLLLSGPTTEVDFALSMEGLPASSYELKIQVGEGREKEERKRTLIIHLEGLSHHVANLDEAIEMLGHIASGKEIKQMKKGSAEARKRAFVAFWQQRDPSPGTPANELMDEYYHRCYYTKKTFGRFRPGWQTDRGRIYILLGPPDLVDRYPFESGTDPVEVWYYSKYNRKFVFVDENGYGEYRLLTENYDIVH